MEWGSNWGAGIWEPWGLTHPYFSTVRLWMISGRLKIKKAQTIQMAPQKEISPFPLREGMVQPIESWVGASNIDQK